MLLIVYIYILLFILENVIEGVRVNMFRFSSATFCEATILLIVFDVVIAMLLYI